MTPNNVTQLRAPVDYPIGARFVHPQTFTRSELIFACWLSSLVGVLVTLGCAALWSFVL